jgi:arylsulfatase A-like enzyme
MSGKVKTKLSALLVTVWTGASLVMAGLPSRAAAATPEKPNIVLIVADDLGYGDLSIQGAKDISTPNIDSIATGGVRCTNGYASAPLCSPTRSGLLTGRYQQRFGSEVLFWNNNNNVGLPLTETTFVQRLRDAGYVTGMVGKWHLGKEAEFHPMSRGFMEFFGNPGHGSAYMPPSRQQRGRETVTTNKYLTEVCADEAVGFIDRHADKPFFLYLPFNAPHAPMQATEEYLKRCSHIADPKRRTYAAMVTAFDDAVGRVLDRLREQGLQQNTLVAFFSDNGGSCDCGAANTPLKGGKASMLEGGIRSPFFMRWPEKLKADTVYNEPVISLDFAPTILNAAGIKISPDWHMDGVDLIPYLRGDKTSIPHEALYWRYWQTGPVEPGALIGAMREGPWKLVTANYAKPGQEKWSLFYLPDDIGETSDLAAKEPQRAADMAARWSQWSKSMAKPLWWFEVPK